MRERFFGVLIWSAALLVVAVHFSSCQNKKEAKAPEIQPHWLYVMTQGAGAEWPEELTITADTAGADEAQKWLAGVKAFFPGVELENSSSELFASRYAQDPVDAKTRIVDELMSKGNYGELMQEKWLEVVGDESLKHSIAFERYRDWLRRSFQDDVPLLEIVGSQMTSDLFEGADVVPTSFLRVSGYDSGSGRVSQLGRILFGEEGLENRVLSRQQRAQLTILFRCWGDEERRADAAFREPLVEIPTLQNLKDQTTLKKRESDLAQKNQEIREQAKQKASSWLAMRPGFLSLDGMIDCFEFDQEGAPTANQAVSSYGRLTTDGEVVKGLRGKSILLREGNQIELDSPLGVSAGWPWAMSFWFAVPELPKDGAEPCYLLSKGGASEEKVALELKDNGGFRWHWINDGSKKASLDFEGEIKAGEWMHVTVISHGGVGEQELRLFLNGRSMKPSQFEGNLTFWPLQEDESKKPWFISGSAGGLFVDEVCCFAKPLSALEVAEVFSGRSFAAALTDPERWKEALTEYYMTTLDPDYRAWMSENALAVKFAQVLGQSIPMVPVMRAPESLNVPNPLLVVDVTRDHLPIPPEAMKSRQAFAEWYARGGSVLAKRVIVNHLLKSFLGDGLMPDAEQRLESEPSRHVEVLDQLVRFADTTNWSAKAFVRQMLISSYRSRS